MDERTLPPHDRAADGIAVVDLDSLQVTRTLASGQYPESFDVSSDGKALYVSNEETGTVSILSISASKYSPPR